MVSIQLIIGETTSDKIAFFVNLFLSLVYITMACVSSWLYTKRSDAIIRTAFGSAKAKSFLRKREKKERREARQAAKLLKVKNQQTRTSNPETKAATSMVAETQASLTARSSTHTVISSSGSASSPMPSNAVMTNEEGDESKYNAANPSSSVPKRSARQAYQTKRLSNNALNGQLSKRQSTLQRQESSLGGNTAAVIPVGSVGTPLNHYRTGIAFDRSGISIGGGREASGISMPSVEASLSSPIPHQTSFREKEARFSATSRRKQTEDDIPTFAETTTIAAPYQNGPRRMQSGLSGVDASRLRNSGRNHRSNSIRRSHYATANVNYSDADEGNETENESSKNKSSFGNRFKPEDEEEEHITVAEWCVAGDFNLGYVQGVNPKFLVKPQSLASDNIGRFFLFLVVFLISRSVTNLVLVILQKHSLYYGDDTEVRAQQDMLETLPTYLYFMMPLVLLYMFASMLERADPSKARAKRVVRLLFIVINGVFWGLFILYQAGAISIEQMETRSVGISITYVVCYTISFFYFPRQFAQFGETAVKDVIRRVQESCLVFVLCSGARFIMVLDPVQTALENSVTPPWFFAIYMPLDIVPTCLIMFFLHKRSVGFRSAPQHPTTTGGAAAQSNSHRPSNRSEASDANQSMASQPIGALGANNPSGEAIDALPLLGTMHKANLFGPDIPLNIGASQVVARRDAAALIYDRRSESFDCIGEVDSEGSGSSRSFSQDSIASGRESPSTDSNP